MAQRKERTLGYEGRYRRTLSPSGLGSNNNISKSSLESPSPGAPDSVGSTRSMTNLGGVGTGKLDTSLSPAGKFKQSSSFKTVVKNIILFYRVSWPFLFMPYNILSYHTVYQIVRGLLV